MENKAGLLNRKNIVIGFSTLLGLDFIHFLTDKLYSGSWGLISTTLSKTNISALNYIAHKASCSFPERLQLFFLDFLVMAVILFMVFPLIASFAVKKREYIKKTKFLSYFMSAWTPITIIILQACCLGSLYWIYSTEILLTAAFNHRMTLISPVISDNQEETIRADWASMTTWAELLKIMNRIDVIAGKNSISLKNSNYFIKIEDFKP